MYIGDALQKERIKLGLSQEKMAANIVSRSYYSKVENNKYSITAEKLFNLLNYHNISIIDFLRRIQQSNAPMTETIEDILSRELSEAFYSRDIKRVYELKKQIDRSEVSKELKIRVELVLAIIRNSLDALDNNFKKEVKEYLFVDDWVKNEWTLKLFGNAMILFSKEYLNIYISQVIKYYKNIRNFPLETQTRICTIFINYLFNTYKNPDIKRWDGIFSILKDTAQHPSLGMYRLVGLYFRTLKNKDITMSKSIRKVLLDSGDYRISKLLPLLK